MRFLERAIRKGVGDALGKAIGKAIEPTATELANKTANAIDNATQSTRNQFREAQQSVPPSQLENAMANLERSVSDYATKAAQNMKLCPACGKTTSAEKRFCPECGTKLPEQTVAQGAVCPSCGKQNGVGTKFCQECGTKLPAAIAEEQAAEAADQAVLTQWQERMPQYPLWNCGGTGYTLEEYEDGIFSFTACFPGDHAAARRAVAEYRQILLDNGFRQAGQYPSPEQLYKMADGICYHVDTSMCFEGSSDCPNLGFDIREPQGGYNYVKPEPKKKVTFRDLLGL